WAMSALWHTGAPQYPRAHLLPVSCPHYGAATDEPAGGPRHRRGTGRGPPESRGGRRAPTSEGRRGRRAPESRRPPPRPARDAPVLTEWLLVLLGVALTAGTAVFVAAEFSLVAMDPATVDRRVAAGDKRALGVQRALQHLSTELSGAQVGITLTTVLLGYTAQSALVTLLSGPLGSTGLATAAAGATAVVVSLVLVNGFS